MTDPAAILGTCDALLALLAKGRRKTRAGWLAVNRDDLRLALGLAELALRCWALAHPTTPAVQPDGAPTDTEALERTGTVKGLQP